MNYYISKQRLAERHWNLKQALRLLPRKLLLLVFHCQSQARHRTSQYLVKTVLLRVVYLFVLGVAGKMNELVYLVRLGTD